MILIVCSACRLALRTSGDPSEVDYLVGTQCEWYPNKYPCPMEDCPGPMVITDTIASIDIEHIDIRELTPQETFQALCGMGLPNEKVCTADYLREVLSKQQVASVQARDIVNTSRCVLDSITLGNGYRIYLGASPMGAVVYRIAPPRVEEFNRG